MTTSPPAADPAPSAIWIWSQQAHPGQYLRFRRMVDLEHRPATAKLVVSAETDFVAYVNGQLAGCGQFSDWPDRKTATTIDVAHLLHPGTNLLAIAAYHNGLDNSAYCAGLPGIIAALSGDLPTIVSGTDWRCSEDPAYRQGIMPVVTLQMGRVFERDARHDEPWLETGFDDAAWADAVPVAFPAPGRPSLRERPIAALHRGPPLAVRLAGCGQFIRTRQDGTIAERMSTDALIATEPQDCFTERRAAAFYDAEPPLSWYGRRLAQPDGTHLTLAAAAPGTTGRYLIIDLGQEEVGHLTLRIDAPAGTVIDIAHGEHLQRGRVAARLGYRNFADRFICAAGSNDFTHWFRRLGCRYIEAHIHGADGPVRIDYLGLLPVSLGLAPVQPFASSDDALDAIDAVSVRTLQLCMHEHYEDCPWREQALYTFDARNQALFGYHVFGNHQFAATSFELFAGRVRPDGWLPLCAPSRIPLTIPVFSLVWIGALAEHWLYSGDGRPAQRLVGVIDRILDAARADADPATGLYRTPTGQGLWNFYEWSDGLAGRIPDEHEVVRPEADRLDAPFNLFLLEALGDAAWIHRQSGDAAGAERLLAVRSALARAIVGAFWDGSRSAIASFRHGATLSHHAELVQGMALSSGILTPPQAGLVAAQIGTGSLIPATLPSLRPLGAALAGHSPQTRQTLESLVRRTWGAMLRAGATSFWETANGADDFDGAGSLCHGWSAFPAYFTAAIHLGIRPLLPGFARFQVAPYAGRLHHASGAIPTPQGPIRVAWQRKESALGITLTGPPGLEPVLRPLPECPIARATYNGAALPTATTGLAGSG